MVAVLVFVAGPADQLFVGLAVEVLAPVDVDAAVVVQLVHLFLFVG